MLATVGVQYMVSQRWSEATKVLQRAHEISEAINDPVLKARTNCPLALLTILNGEGPAAEAMMTRALSELPQRPEYAQLRAECLTRYSEFGYFTGEAAPMIRHASDALALLDSASIDSAARRIDTQSALAYGYYLAHDHRRADETFRSLAEQLTAAGMEQTLAAADIFNNWSLVHYHSDIRKAEPLIRRTVELRRSIEGADAIAPTALFNHASVLLKLGRLQEAEPVYQEVIRTAAAREELNTFYDATMELTEVYVQSGQLAAAERQLAKVLPHEGERRFDMTRRAQLLYYQGRLAETRGNIADARARFAETVRQLDEIKQRTFLSVEAYCGLSRAERALANKQAAANAAQRALDFANSFAEPQSPSYLVGMALLEVGQAQRASGAIDESIRSFELARENLESTLGPEHALTQQVAGLLTAG
jgi:tetratricopeptide (TPR) repeat protein